MGEAPKVSVCVAVYNGADYLARALKSVGDQTYRDFELIVVDDGSKDQSAKIAETFGATVIRQPNSGVGVARRRLLEEAKGEWMTFLDHDDYWAPDFLERMMRHSGDPDTVHVYCDAFVFSDKGDPRPAEVPAPLGPESLGHIIPQRIWNPCSIFKREPMMKLKAFDSGLKAGEDWLGWFLLATVGKLKYVEERLVFIMRREGSTSSPTRAYYEAEAKVISTVLDNFASWYPAMPADRAKFYQRKLREKLGLILSLQGPLEAHKRTRRGLHTQSIRLAPRLRGVWYRFLKSLF